MTTIVVFDDHQVKSWGYWAYLDNGFSCPTKECDRYDVGEFTPCYLNSTSGGVHCSRRATLSPANALNTFIQTPSHRFLKCLELLLHQKFGCCLRNDGRLFCEVLESLYTMDRSDWAYITRGYNRDANVVAVTQDGQAYVVDASGSGEPILRRLLEGQAVIAGGLDSAGSEYCFLSAVPATYGEVMCEGEDMMPPEWIRNQSVASAGCIEFPKQVLDMKHIATFPSTACSNEDQALADGGMNATASV